MSPSPAISSDTTDSAVRYYLSLPYHIALTRDDADSDLPWHAQVEELPGCVAAGATAGEAADRIPSALAEWAATALAEGRSVPEPRSARAYSGKLLLRMPLTLHAELAQAAEREQVSLNAYINGQLAAGIGWRRGPLPAPSQELAAPGQATRRRQFMWALTINLVVVAFAAIVALALLLTAWTDI